MQHRRGKRAGKAYREQIENLRRQDIHSHVRGCKAHNVDHATCNTALIADTAKYHDCAEIEETIQDHVVPRQSETIKQLLPFFPQKTEKITIHAKQRDKQTGRMVETTDEQTVWRSDKTLLIKGNPQNNPSIGTFKRAGYIRQGLNRRNYTETRQELKADGIVLGTEAPTDADQLFDK